LHLLLNAVLLRRLTINIACPPGPQQQTRHTPLQQASGTDRQTDGHRTVT